MGNDLGSGPRKWHKSGVTEKELVKKVPGNSLALVVGVSGASRTHICPYQGSIHRFDALKI